MRAGIIVVVVTAGCSTAYQPGSFSSFGRPFAGERVTLGCVDLAVGRRSDVMPPVVAYSFGNRCDHRVLLDLASVRVVGRDHAGNEIALRPYDPVREIRPLPLPARLESTEQIEYRGPDIRPLASVCIDVGGVNGSIARSEHWVCP